ncbi:hypothetical protein FFWV33_00540 [Flavobacterium faecale]|uniref:Uncharacterized protein n=1 Tax=Flavobacterium faecale TaxID=1355330 RepID=A0A2S1L8Q7_9FLAO|nr:hypothetical protein [Flavobacterium faecale]AWG20111.1 hypothetical protein FFWV33_00540 [Flavobacterium faecale]
MKKVLLLAMLVLGATAIVNAKTDPIKGGKKEIKKELKQVEKTAKQLENKTAVTKAEKVAKD